ncbi:ABC transporter substrate-binding protein [Rhodobacteraceae bacterium Araon29]
MTDKKTNSPTETTRRDFLGKAAASVTGVGALSAAGVLSATNAGAQASGEPIPLGAAVPLTGWAAADGIEYRRGLELAAEEVNALGGILGRPIEFHFEDTKVMGPDNVVPAVQRLIDRAGVHAIINGYNSSTATAEYDLIADDGIIYMHANTDVQHNHTIAANPRKYDTVFMVDPAEAWYGPGLITFLNGLVDSGKFAPENRKIALVLGSGSYGIVIGAGIKETAAEHGWEISMEESVAYGTSEWGPVISNIRKNPPGVIAFTHWVPQDLAQFMVQFAPNPTNSLVYMQYGPSIAAFREIAETASEGVIYSSVAQSLQDEMGLAFMERYRAKHGNEGTSPLNGAIPYDAVFIYAAAAAMAGGTGAPGEFDQNKKIAANIKRSIYRGVLGTTRFDQELQVAIPYPNATNDPSLGMPHQFAQIQDWKKDAAIIAPSPYETASYQTPPWMKS